MRTLALSCRAALTASVSGAVLLASVAAASAQTDGGAATLETYDADTVIATVGGETVTLGDLIAARQRLPAQQQQQSAGDLFEGLLRLTVDSELLVQAAEAEGTADDPAVAAALEEARRFVLSRAYLDSVLQAQLTEEAVRARYDATAADIGEREEIQASHILVESEEDAAAIKAELDGGAEFAALATERSLGPSSAQGGDLGYFQEGMMVQPFFEAANALEVGAVSGPVETRFGWHIITVTDRRPVTPPSFEELQPQLTEVMQREAVEAEMGRLRETVTFEETLPPVEAVLEDGLLGAQ